MTLHLMKNFLSCTLSALFSLTVISAQDSGPVALLEIDFWVNGVNTIEDRTIKTFEKTAEREELITAKLYKEIGIVLQQKQISYEDIQENLSEIIKASEDIFGPGSLNEGLALAAKGMCCTTEPDKGIQLCTEGLDMIEALYGTTCKEWCLAKTFFGILHILAGDNEEAKTAFMSAVRDYRQYAPFYCMPSITILIQTAIKYAEENNAEPAATCIGPAVSLLDIFVSSREKMETAYANLPETYKPICDYDIFGRSYVNLSYACWKSGKIDKAIEVANAGLTAMKEVGQENSRPYSMLKYNLEEFRKAPINSK